jgi:hypothetical protein
MTTGAIGSCTTQSDCSISRRSSQTSTFYQKPFLCSSVQFDPSGPYLLLESICYGGKYMCPMLRHFLNKRDTTLKNYPAYHWCCIAHRFYSMNQYHSYSDFLMIINKWHFLWFMHFLQYISNMNFISFIPRFVVLLCNFYLLLFHLRYTEDMELDDNCAAYSDCWAIVNNSFGYLDSGNLCLSQLLALYNLVCES